MSRSRRRIVYALGLYVGLWTATAEFGATAARRSVLPRIPEDMVVRDVDSLDGVEGPALAANVFSPAPFIIRVRYQYVVGNLGGEGGVAWTIWVPLVVIELSRHVTWRS